MAEHLAVMIRSWKQMWDDYIYEGIKNGVSHTDIRANLLEAFRKEMFDLMAIRLKVEDVLCAIHTPENEAIVADIFKDEKKKWMRLVTECNKHLQTLNLLRESDFKLTDDEEGKSFEAPAFEYEEVDDPEEDDGIVYSEEETTEDVEE